MPHEHITLDDAPGYNKFGMCKVCLSRVIYADNGRIISRHVLSTFDTVKDAKIYVNKVYEHGIYGILGVGDTYDI